MEYFTSKTNLDSKNTYDPPTVEKKSESTARAVASFEMSKSPPAHTCRGLGT